VLGGQMQQCAVLCAGPAEACHRGH
jgi:hypothetical protein